MKLYLYLHKCQLSMCYLKKYQEEKHILYLKLQIFPFFSEALPMWNFNFQAKVQIAQEHKKSKLKNTYRLKELIVESKI